MVCFRIHTYCLPLQPHWSKMGKRDRDESMEDKKERKRAKKESKKRRKEQKQTTEASNGTSTIMSQSTLPTADKNAVFLKKKIELVVSLLPASLKNSEKAVDDSIRQFLLKYSDGVGGILLAFNNVKIEGDGNSQGRGWVLNELPYIHYNVSCDALVFCPEIGCKVCLYFVSQN
jgi:hypothetical protein